MNSRRAWIVLGVLAVPCALLSAFGVVMETIWGDYPETIQFAGITAVFVGMVLASRAWGFDVVTPRSSSDDTGTTFRPDRRLDIALPLVVLGVVINGVCTLSPFVANGQGTHRWPTSLGVVVAVSVAAFLVWRFARWGASKYLRLTPTGIEVGYLRQLSCDWNQVRDVTGVPPGRRARASHDVGILLSDNTFLRLPASTFTPHAAALRNLVAFYWRHPDARVELTDGSAPRRLAATATL
ncbi:hypothetical protein CIW49_21150 [Mycolicibacterium sp. P1-18]|uniref:hypothetical protein n=1 Tax=Mycolicibacterium sp. P1-18 TaxID=2024615 RepID=UPI0011F2907E|nr:hypothetical protein [Mycolicibacterium sp. P1-18]KAA0096044.1 hypothetical protein CIW49_21150 [Mycolicibacterium sp. P1-18]